MTTRIKRGLVHGIATCKQCGWQTQNYRTVQRASASHARRTGHTVLADKCRPVLVVRRDALHEEADNWAEAGDLLSASEAREEAALVDALLASLPREE